MDYSKIEWSRSCETPEITVSLSGGSLSFAKMVGAGLNFMLRRKQFSPICPEINDYRDILDDLRGRSVIFYDTLTKRGWLIDAERATLQVMLHRTKMRVNEPTTMNRFAIAVPEQASSAKWAMEVNQGVKLGKGWDATKGKETDVWFSAKVKDIREELIALADLSRSEFNRCFPRAGLNLRNKGFIGFEYKALVDTSIDPRLPMKVEPNPDCGAWPDLAYDLRAVILLAQNFQEILVPLESALLCPKFQRLPTEKSYLAVEVSRIREFIKRHGSRNWRSRLTSTDMTWIATERVFEPCDVENGKMCSCRRVQGLSKSKDLNDMGSANLCSEGAIIFGAMIPNHLRKSPPRMDEDKENLLQMADTACLRRMNGIPPPEITRDYFMPQLERD